MDPFTLALVALLAFGYATRDSWGHLLGSYAADKRKGQNGPAWWGREALHGFPHARHPFMDTWRAHQAATGQMRENRLKARPGEIQAQRDRKAAIAEHKRLITSARQPASQPGPAPLPAETVGQPASQPVTFRQPLELVDEPPVSQPADTGWPGGVQPPETRPCPHCGRKTYHPVSCPLYRMPPRQAKAQTQKGHDPMACKDPNCACHQRQGSAPGAPTGVPGPNGSGGTMTSTATGDTTYDDTNATLDSIAQYTEAAINDAAIAQAEQLADALPTMIPDDSETVGHISDAVASLQAAQAAQKAAQDSITAARNSHTTNFAAQHEAVQATGHDAERGYMGVS